MLVCDVREGVHLSKQVSGKGVLAPFALNTILPQLHYLGLFSENPLVIDLWLSIFLSTAK